MTDFLFRKNQWILDIVTTMFFAFFCAYMINTDSDTGNPNSKTHWNLILLELSIYILTFILAFLLHKKFVWLKSWAFISVISPLIRAVTLVTIYLPNEWKYAENFSSSRQEAVEKIIYWATFGFLFDWIVFSVVLMLLILTVRFFAFVFLNIVIFTSDQFKFFTGDKGGLNLK